jgi:PIN domain nuclease of toxin-antitoxin system
MKLLLDTHLLLWAAVEPARLSRRARRLMDDPDHELLFSPVSLWEVAIKRQRRRADFNAEPRLLRRSLLNAGYEELTITSEHAVAIDLLPPLHRDPFDRMLIAQSLVEGITVLTADRIVARYPIPVQLV